MNKPLNFIEINKSNLLHNFNTFRKKVEPAKKICAVVKANAYGHGCREIVRVLNRKADYFQVDDYEEFLEISNITDKPILISGYVSEKNLKEVAIKQGIMFICDRRTLNIMEEIGKNLAAKIPIHLKLDALLGRQGVLIDKLPEFVSYLKQLEHIELQGVCSHLSDADDPKSKHTLNQLKEFRAGLEIIRSSGFNNVISHISATSGTLVLGSKDNGFDMVRVGIGLYGLWPSQKLKEECKELDLKPVLRWISHISQVKTLPKNYPVGYNLSFITKKKTRVGLIPQGYSDGYDRKLSNRGAVLIKGFRCPVLGRVAMNLFVVDVSHVGEIDREEEVVLLGKQLENEITASEIASIIGTINYEVVSRISPTIKRKTI